MQGASTITQQYVRQALVETNAQDNNTAAAAAATSKNLTRKLTEARYALALEQKLSKDQILEDYLNTVYFGNGAYGVSAAAQHYFNETVRQADTAAVGTARRRDQQPQHVRPDAEPEQCDGPPQHRARPDAGQLPRQLHRRRRSMRRRRRRSG